MVIEYEPEDIHMVYYFILLMVNSIHIVQGYCPSFSGATVKNMCKYIILLHQETRQNKAEQNCVCII